MAQTQSTYWVIHPHEKGVFQKKRGDAKLFYLLLLRCFEQYHFFPQTYEDIPEAFLAKDSFETILSQKQLEKCFGQNKPLNRYKREIRKYCGWEAFTHHRQKFQKLLDHHLLKEKNDEAVLQVLSGALVQSRIEVPPKRVFLGLIKKERKLKEAALFQRIEGLLSQQDKQYIDNHLLVGGTYEGIQFLRQDAAASNKNAVKEEIKRLQILQELPLSLFSFINEIHPRQLNYYKRKFLTDTPERSHRRPDTKRYALTIIFCYQRHIQALDNLIDHLLHFIHQIKKTKERKQNKLQKEVGKTLNNIGLLYQLAQINRDNPKEIIEKVVYPAVSQDQIDQIIKARTTIQHTQTIVQETVIKRYSQCYRSIIFMILGHLDIQSENVHLIEALKVIQHYAQKRSKYYPCNVPVPLEGFLSKKAQKQLIVYDDDKEARILRKEYECAVFKILYDQLRHKAAWVAESHKYRHPGEDLPKGFDDNPEPFFLQLGLPLSADSFIDTLQQKMCHHLKVFDEEFPENKHVVITQKQGKPWITLTPLQKVEEPQFLQKLKSTVLQKWGMIDLLDILKEVDLREGITECFATAGNREILDRNTTRKRLLLCLFALGTNAGFKRTAGASRGAVTFEELRHIKKFFINKDDLREAIDKVVNAILKMRNPLIWKAPTTACAADSKQFSCYANNLLSEWSPRHNNDGVMIYWHVNDQYICVYSQLKSCTSSEVASMLQGIVSQETDMEISMQYVDSHGKSELGFALSYLENFDLLPRYKTIGNQKLYLPKEDFRVQNIQPITTRSIRWDIIKDQYMEMVKYAAALKVGTATAETVIRRFAKTNYQHPTFKAFIELGKAVKTIFLCRYLSSLALRQQINAGLNIVENWNSANDFVFYGKSGEISSNDRDDQELSMLSLHLLQNCIIYINTLLIEELFQEAYWLHHLEAADYRALNALFYLHINPYGTFYLDLSKRLSIQQVGYTP